MTFNFIPPGRFLIGSPGSPKPDETPHRVTLTEGYWLRVYRATRSQWAAVMDENLSKFKGIADADTRQADRDGGNQLPYLS
jgi:formylglycine-generating enzyme required for sulfatase activity